jgi:hypothetical protein
VGCRVEGEGEEGGEGGVEGIYWDAMKETHGGCMLKRERQRDKAMYGVALLKVVR